MIGPLLIVTDGKLGRWGGGGVREWGGLSARQERLDAREGVPGDDNASDKTEYGHCARELKARKHRRRLQLRGKHAATETRHDLQ